MTPYLPADWTRCRPGCAARRDTCGRFLAPLPAAGAIVEDFAKVWNLSPHDTCAWYRAASRCTVQAFTPPARRVHGPLGS